MSFIHQNRIREGSKNAYLITLISILLAYLFVGQIPLAIAVSMVDVDAGDPMQLLQVNYGLTPTFILVLFPLLCVFAAILLCVRYAHKWKITSVFNAFGSIRYKRIIQSFLVWGLLSGTILLIGWNNQIQENFDVNKFLPLFFIALIVIPFQCAAEELVFRSYLFQWLGLKIKQVWIIVLIGGLFFGLLHGANPEIGALGTIALVYYIWSGIFLGILVAVDDGIELSLGYHIANNLFGTLIVTSEWQAFQTDALFIDINPPSFTFWVMLLLILSQLIFAVVFKQLYKWKGIAERLK
jgi:hypothetical protein